MMNHTDHAAGHDARGSPPLDTLMNSDLSNWRAAPVEAQPIDPFTYETRGPRIVFGAGVLDRLGDEIKRLGVSRALVLCTPGRASELTRIGKLLGDSMAGSFAHATPHVPVGLVDDVLKEARETDADCYVSFGGGSATGLAKALSLREQRPIVAIPTTYAGSEVTPVWGTTDGGRKTTGRNERVLPATVLYDPALTLGLPREATASSSMNAIAHCVEALYAADANPVTSLLAEEGIRRLARSLPGISRDPVNLETRTSALYGAYLAGSALAAVSMGLHHKLCHLLGGTFDLPHAATHAVMLPQVLAFNAPAIGEAAQRIADALGAEESAGALYDLARSSGAPLALQQIGLREADLERAIELAADLPVAHPRPATRRELSILFTNAFRGVRPEAAASGHRAGQQGRSG